VRLYGPAFVDTWPTLIVVLVTAGIVAVTNPVGYVLAASEKVWLGFWMNSGWALVFLAATVPAVRWGALGLAGARLFAYVVHSTWSVWYAARFVRTGGATHAVT
jgi:O-antigen/teichoic acid export membrane protein